MNIEERLPEKGILIALPMDFNENIALCLMSGHILVTSIEIL